MAVGGRNPHLYLSFSLTASYIRFSDRPEIGPGAFIGSSSSSTTSRTGTFPYPTVFPTVTSPPSFSPTSSFLGRSGSNTGAIVGSVVGGVAVIVIAVLGFFYIRQQHMKAPTATFAGGGALPRHVTQMGVYVRIFVPSFYSCVLMYFLIPYAQHGPAMLPEHQGPPRSRGYSHYNGLSTV
jgi:hypothetical protein